MKHVKAGVRFDKIHPETVELLVKATVVFNQWGYDLVVTCGTDSHEDRPTSLHNHGYALDLRCRHIRQQDILGLVRSLRLSLGLHYDVVYGDKNHRDHIHVEYHPKGDDGQPRELGPDGRF